MDGDGNDSLSTFISAADNSLFNLLAGDVYASGPGTVPLNAWFHLAVTYDGSTARCYLNGNEVASFTKARVASTGPLYIGNRGGNGHYFNGLIDEVETFSRALSQAEILAIVNAGTNGKCRPQIVRTNPGQCYATVTNPPAFSDNCPGATIVCTPAQAPKGTNAISCVITDASGNKTTNGFTMIVQDMEGPRFACTDITNSTASGQCGAVVALPTTATDNCDVSVPVTCDPTNGTVFPKGVTTVTCDARDTSGFGSRCIFTVRVNDTEAPAIACPTDITQTNDLNACGAVVTFAPTVSDNCPGVTSNCVPASGSLFAVGTNTVTCTARDAAGHTNACAFKVTVNDAQAPTLACPARVVVNAATGASNAVVNFTATVTDNCSTPVVTCSPTNGSTFPLGTNAVVCTATDASGNTNACAFSVIVENGGPACLLAWKFDESSGLIALDSSGNMNLGALTNGPIRTNGVVGRALRFDGSNDRVQAANASSLNVTGAFTVACWVRPETLSDYRYFLVKGNDANERLAYGLRSYNSKLEYRWVSPAGVQSAIRSTTNVLAVGRWTHVAAAHAPGSAPMLFVNGVAVPASVIEGFATNLIGTSPHPFCVGASADNVDRFKGTIDEVFVCLTKLTAGQIRNLTNGLPPGPPPPLPAPGIVTASPLPDGRVGAAYAQSLTATGGTPGFTWSLVSGALPGGLMLNTNTGALTGTPTIATTNTFRVRVRDTAAQTAEKDFTLAIPNAPVGPPSGTGCLVHWKFDETSGTAAIDSTGSGNHAALLNGPVRTNGMVGRALRFDGSNDRVQATNATSLNVTGALTLAVWVRPESVSDSAYLLIKGEDDGDDYAYALRTSSGKVRYRWVAPNGNVNEFQTTPVVLSVGRWTHLAVVHTPGRAPVLYTNGAVVAATLQNGSATAQRGTSPYAFAAGASADDEDPFKGALDEVVVCVGSLSLAEIQGLLTGTLPAPPESVPLPVPATLTAPIACAVRVVEGLATLSWPAEPGRVYRVQYKDRLTDREWSDLTGDVYVPGTEAGVDDAIESAAQRFYRVLVRP